MRWNFFTFLVLICSWNLTTTSWKTSAFVVFVRQPRPLLHLQRSRPCLSASSTTKETSTTSTRTTSTGWFPTRIQDAVVEHSSSSSSSSSSVPPPSYEQLVPRLYLRHIVLETREMAQVALQMYQQELLQSDIIQNSNDPFGHVAQLLSVESRTASQGGTIGWVETVPTSTIGTTTTEDDDDHDDWLLLFPTPLLRELVSKRPKVGDVYILPDRNRNQWQVVQVAELWLQPLIFSSLLSSSSSTSAVVENDLEKSSKGWTTTTTTNNNNTNKNNSSVVGVVGAHVGHDRVLPRRRKLKGRGILPQFPSDLRHYSIQTVGCQMNVADSERLAGILQTELGMQPLEIEEQEGEEIKGIAPPNNNQNNNDYRPKQKKHHHHPDLMIWNTCSIRDRAEQKLYNAVGPYAAAKRQGKNGGVVLVVTGCVAQQEGERLLKRIPEIDAVVGPQYIPFMKNILELVSYGQQVVATSPMLIPEQDILSAPPVRGHTVRAFVNVIYGCNEHCTYCVVPATRGTEQSRSMESILAECLDLVNRGYKEITLIGQNIDAYGRDMVPKRTFADLLVFLNARLGVVPNNNNDTPPHQDKSLLRLRYVTSHPRYFSPRVIDAVLSLDKVCECFHMPFQAGDDGVLKRMRRGYTYDSYLKIIRRIQNASPDASITTDIIVGFPGETDEAFQKTLQLMEAVKFDNVNSFCYSPRPNTEAALWPDQVPDSVKADRLQQVQRLALQHAMERSLRYVGRIEEVLVEDSGHSRNPRQVVGRTRQGRHVYFDGDLTELRGKFVQVRITEARPWSLIGELLVTM